MNELKFCKDCKHFADNAEVKRMFDEVSLFVPYKSWCKHQKNRKFDLVDGTESFIYTCHELRWNKDRDGELFFCGEVAHWFEKKDAVA